jgi:hypothetical protein
MVKAGFNQSNGDGSCRVISQHRTDVSESSEMKLKCLADIGDMRVEREFIVLYYTTRNAPYVSRTKYCRFDEIAGAVQSRDLL